MQRRVEGTQPGRVDVLVEDAGDRAPEALEHVLLARERLHDADPGDALLGLRGQLGDPLLHLLQRRPREPVEARRGDDDERHRRQRQQRQPGLDRDHHRAREQDRERVLGEEDQPVAEEEADRLQVHRRPRHQLARSAGASKKPSSSACRCAVEALAEVELDAERDLAGDQAADDGQTRAAGARRRRSPSASGSRSRRGRGSRSRRRPRRPATGSAPSSPSPPRRSTQRADHRAAVRAQEPEQPPESAHRHDYTN